MIFLVCRCGVQNLGALPTPLRCSNLLDLPRLLLRRTPPHPDRPKWGFTRQPENSKRVHLRVPAFNHTTNPRNDLQEGKKRHENGCERRKKKREILGPSQPFGTPAFGDPPRDCRTALLFWVVVCAVLLLILLRCCFSCRCFLPSTRIPSHFCSV